MVFDYFPALISVGYKLLEAHFASENQLNHIKTRICHSSGLCPLMDVQCNLGIEC